MFPYRFAFCLALAIGLSTVAFSQSIDKKSNTQIADSLDLRGQYKAALHYRSLALKENNHSSSFNSYIEANWHYTKSCIYEATGGLDNHKKALEHSIKAREIYGSNSSIWFKNQIANRIYHQYGYSQDWKNALIEAQNNLEILIDSLPKNDPKVLIIMDDLGFINTKLGDYNTALKFYENVEQIYLKYYPENKRDLAMNYNVMATNYRILGMRKKELLTLFEIEKLWKQIPENHNFPLINCYKKLSAWYAYYGNYDLAETYLNKQALLIDSIQYKDTEFKAKNRNSHLELYKNYIEIYLKKNDYNKAQEYVQLSEHELESSKREFSEDVSHEASLYFYKSQFMQHNSEASIALIRKAIDLISTYQHKFFLDPTNYKIALFKSYLKAGQYANSEIILQDIIETTSTDLVHQQFFLFTNYGALLSKRKQFQLAEDYFRKALNFYLLNPLSESDPSKIKFNDIKPLYSFESIDGIVLAANFYLERYRDTTNSTYLNCSENLFDLASDIFNNLYLGDRYNETLFNTYKTIEKGLMTVLIHQPSEKNIKKTIEAIENNASKLTWSKFMYNQERPTLSIPDSIITLENDLKSLFNYYQNALYNKSEKQQLENDTLQHRISALNLELKKLQEHIKSNYSKYHNQIFNTFNLQSFRELQNKDNLILKYVFSEDHLFCFLISKSKLEFVQLDTSIKLKSDIENYIKKLSTFNSDYLKDLNYLKTKIIPNTKPFKATHMTIVPDGVLSYLPFEILFLNSKSKSKKLSNYSISYANSLTLLKEQNNIQVNDEQLNVGLFYTSRGIEKELPSVSRETEGILNYVTGQAFDTTSKTAFLKESKNFNILHLAMHSHIDGNHPEFSNLDFGNDRLLISDLYNESINANLAVLSACETGSGTISNGEGIQSISKAFTFAGIPSTVVSLWKVDDEATSIIMTGFYKYLKDGMTKDVALKNAKIDYLKSTSEVALKHPYYWAGFVVNGNTSALVPDKSKYIYVSLASLSLLLLLIFRKKLQLFK